LNDLFVHHENHAARLDARSPIFRERQRLGSQNGGSHGTSSLPSVERHSTTELDNTGSEQGSGSRVT